MSWTTFIERQEGVEYECEVSGLWISTAGLHPRYANERKDSHKCKDYQVND